ncbi:MAG: DUF4124 domain-containing protein [Gammaproteobacteria bacterium]|nr:DUF4124 domain-containing protein [Gammaproteobacteria bacterium]
MNRYFYLLILLLCSTTAVNAEMYRWMDENGKVHYSDKIPAQHQHRGHAKLSKQGVVIDKVASSLTPAQQQHRMQEEKLRLLQQKFQQQHLNSSQSLLDQYNSADDLIMTRDGKTAKIERSIDIMTKRRGSIRESLARQQKRIDAIQSQGESVSVDMIQKLLRLRHSVKESDTEIAQAEVKMQQLHELYTLELQRYRHLKQPDKYPPPASWMQGSEPIEGVIICSPGNNCKHLWKRAVAYVRKHSDTAVKLQTDEIVITDPAVQDNKISLILSLIKEADGETFLIYLDVQCRASARRAPCDSKQAISVLHGFRPAVLNP